MTQAEYDKRMEELEAEADRRGCCIIPAVPVQPPDGSPGTARPTLNGSPGTARPTTEGSDGR